MPDWKQVSNLRAGVANHADALTLAAPSYSGFRSLEGGSQTAESDQLPAFALIDGLLDLLLQLNPRRVLSLGHGAGPEPSEEAAMALAALRIYVPDIPETVLGTLHGQYMFLNR